MTTEPNDNDIFDSVISGERNADIAPVEPEVVPQQPQARDETGRFAPTATTPTPPAEGEPPVQTPAATTPEGVPVAAVQDERRKRQEAERRAEELERRLAALEAKSAQPQAPIEPQTPVTIWDDPDAFLKGQLTPLQQELASVREMILEQRAEGKHGAEKLSAAKAAMEAITDDNARRALASEVFGGGNPFDNLVKWHDRQQTLATVGNDPQAWLQSEIDKKLADPEFLAQAIERARSGAAPVVPGRNNAPLVNLPPSLSKLPAGGNTVQNAEQTDSGMFAAITSARRK